jgi:hypothetical protein
MARTLATYVERRAYMTPGRRREVARGLTEPLLQKFEFRPDIDPDLLMIALYHWTFIADPRDPPPDLGPLAGHSPLAKDFGKAAKAPSTALPDAAAVPNAADMPSETNDEPLVVAEIVDDARPNAASPGATS